ncbi:MAG TPA: 2-dehydropantoate 2-reductase [Longimicrobiaceae bacterium]|nr:2-dehydropantoate 2-reductase [Longimicrobiaceae bacterium]
MVSPAAGERGEPSAEARIAVVGPGAIGGCIAAHLRAAGHHVLLCAREPFETLVVNTPSGMLRDSPRVETDPGQVGPFPWVLLATKAHQTDGASAWLRALAGPESRVAVLQNGVEHEARVAPLVPGAAVLPVVVDCPAERTAPGRVIQRGPAKLTVPAGRMSDTFAALFAGSAVEVSIVDDFETARWRKLSLNVAGGAVTALTGRTLGVAREPEIAWLARELVLECVRVARAQGARLNDAIADDIVASMQAGDPGAGTSMLSDLVARRPLEADARNGAVVRIGARHGIPTPLNRAATALLLALNRGA